MTTNNKEAVHAERIGRPGRRKALTKDQIHLAISTFTALLNNDCRRLSAYLMDEEIVVEELGLIEDGRKHA